LQDVLQRGHERFLVDEVEVNEVLCCKLDSNVAFDVVYEGPLYNFVIIFPNAFFQIFVVTLLKEINAPRTSNNECFATKQQHLVQVLLDVKKLMTFYLLWVLGVDHQYLALSVEVKDLFPRFTVKTLYRKVLHVAVHFQLADLALHSLVADVPNAVVMSSSVAMKYTYVQELRPDEAASSKGIVESLIDHGIGIQDEDVVNDYFILLDFFLRSSDLRKSS
jgi:hypothetical protein